MENNGNKHNILEKVTFYLGLFILLLLVSYLIFDFNKQKDLPAELEIVTTYMPSMPNYTYKVETTNTGHETASSVHIGFDLYQKGQMVEKAVLTFDYVPRESTEEGWIIFRKTRIPSDSLVITSVSFLGP